MQRTQARAYDGANMLEPRIQQHFFDSADLHYQTAESLARPLADAAQALVGCITSGGKLLVAGAGGQAALATYFCAALVGRFERQRPPLAALALAADGACLMGVAAACGLEQAYAQQVLALGQPGDVLLVLDDDGSAGVLRKAVAQARVKDMPVIALTGRQGGALAAALGETDVHIAVPHDRVARVREMHLLLLHCLCDAVDLQLMGEQEPT